VNLCNIYETQRDVTSFSKHEKSHAAPKVAVHQSGIGHTMSMHGVCNVVNDAVNDAYANAKLPDSNQIGNWD